MCDGARIPSQVCAAESVSFTIPPRASQHQPGQQSQEVKVLIGTTAHVPGLEFFDLYPSTKTMVI